MSRNNFIAKHPFVLKNEFDCYYVAGVPNGRETTEIEQATVFDEHDNREMKANFLSAIHRCEFKAVEMVKPVAEIANVFGCTPEQVKAQMARNASSLQAMADKAVTTGRKVNGYTARQLEQHAANFGAAAK